MEKIYYIWLDALIFVFTEGSGDSIDKPAAEHNLETAVVSLFLAKQPVDYLRVHNVDVSACF